MTIRMTTLPNGLRIVTDSAHDIESIAVGVWVGVGTRHEDLSQNGIAHMLEHMVFKGTPTRTAKQISDMIEDAGGHFNAYTGRELTAYYVRILDDYLDLSLEVLADILQRPSFPDDEIVRERAVISQEIKMYEDTPEDLIFDHALQHAFPDQSVGASGLGSVEIINRITGDDLRTYIGTHYIPRNIVISGAGNIDHDEFVQKICSYFDVFCGQNSPDHVPGFVPARYAPSPSLRKKDIEQAHVIVAVKGLSRLDPRYQAQRLLSGILGGGTSSRLWQEVREKRGLVYSIHTMAESFSDCGLFGFYAGTGPEELKELIPLAMEELRKVQTEITEQELDRAKMQITSGLRMSREKMLTRADQQGRYILQHGKIFEIAKTVEDIRKVSAQDVMNLARDLFAGDLLVAGLGPIDHLIPPEEMTRILRG